VPRNWRPNDQRRIDALWTGCASTYCARSFVDFVREVVNQEFRLGLLVRVERVTAKQIVGSADFGNNRQPALAKVEEGIFLSRGRLPKPCRTGPILDRLLACTEIVRAPDRFDSELGELKRECVARFRNDGTISDAVKSAEPDGTSPYFRYLFPDLQVSRRNRRLLRTTPIDIKAANILAFAETIGGD
jgi:hypothetical protein